MNYFQKMVFNSLKSMKERRESKYLEAVQEEALDKQEYFFKPSELFHVVAEAGANGEFILDDVRDVLNDIEQSTMGADSADDFNGYLMS
ncbi:hypothetical protein O9992_09550 [Vibrio lentus]|nr:hypothetical protein [Vibrio lentus]